MRDDKAFCRPTRAADVLLTNGGNVGQRVAEPPCPGANGSDGAPTPDTGGFCGEASVGVAWGEALIGSTGKGLPFAGVRRGDPPRWKPSPLDPARHPRLSGPRCRRPVAIRGLGWPLRRWRPRCPPRVPPRGLQAPPTCRVPNSEKWDPLCGKSVWVRSEVGNPIEESRALKEG